MGDMERRTVNTTLSKELYKKIRILALKEECHANDLMEEGMKAVLEKYGEI